MDNRCDENNSDRKYCELHGKMAENGVYFRRSDSKKIKRWRCLACGRTKSQATGTSCFGQNKRRVNAPLRAALASGMSERRAALVFKIDKNTVAQKKKFFGVQAKRNQDLWLKGIRKHSILRVQFDEMETFEHTKLKPLSIAVVVCPASRKILGTRVSVMPARGPMAKKSIAKYGKRIDERKEAMITLFKELKVSLHPKAELTSDKKSSYPGWIRSVNPLWQHIRVKGRKPCSVGQGELKEGGYDPLFYLNHTCAMIRDSVKRLARRTWCTTKKLENLQNHLDIYQDFHNTVLVA